MSKTNCSSRKSLPAGAVAKSAVLEVPKSRSTCLGTIDANVVSYHYNRKG